MSVTGRRLRVAASSLVALLLLSGSVWGSDANFPFGPFRMFATSGRTTGAVRVAELVGTTRDGRTAVIDAHDVGLRRAELEGRYPRLRDDPALLEGLADVHGGLVELRLQERVRRVVDRRPVGETEVRVLATWRRS